MGNERKLISELRHRVTFQKRDFVSDGQGGADETWVDVITVWASFQPKAGSRLNFAERIEARTTAQVIIRDLGSQINEDMKVIFNGKENQIRAIDRFENNKSFFQSIDVIDKAGS